MFKNVGEKIKVCSVVIFILLLLSGIVGAIVLWATLGDWVDGAFWIGLGTLVGGFAVALFFSLMVQGYGIIVSDHEKETAEKNPTNYNGNLFNDMDKNNAANKAPKSVPVSGEWTCSKCGRVNQNYVGTCGCGEVKPK